MARGGGGESDVDVRDELVLTGESKNLDHSQGSPLSLFTVLMSAASSRSSFV